MKCISCKLVSLVLLVVIGGCATVASDSSDVVLVQVDDILTGAMQTRPAIADVDGQPALLYASKENRVVLQRGKQRQFLDETAPVRGGNRFQLNNQDQSLSALWWSHQDAKNLYFTSSVDKGQSFAPVSIVNDAHGVLAPFSMLNGPHGVVGMTYLDERQPRYQAYFNRSTDFGRSWARPDQRLDAPPADDQQSVVLDLQSVESGSVWVSAWLDVTRTSVSPNYKIVSSRTEDYGLHWSKPEVLISSEKFISALVVQAQGNNVVIAADEHERGIIALVSSDQGSHWQGSGVLEGTSPPAGAENPNNSGIRMAIAGDQAHLVWMQDRKGVKTLVKRGRLDLVKAKWMGDAVRLDTKLADNTRSVLPVVLGVPNGPLAVAWLDYRDIRPNVYLSTSSDNGVSWTSARPLLKPGEVSAGLPRLIPWGNQLAVAYEIYPSGVASEGSFVLRLVNPGDGGKGLPEFGDRSKANETDRKTRLEQRVKALWDNRVAGNYQTAYEIFDFAFKAANPLQAYLNSVGVLTYLNYSLEDTSIQGNEATVKMKIKYEAKATVLPNGKPLKSTPPVEADAENTWVWVGNDWFFVYKPVAGESLLQY